MYRSKEEKIELRAKYIEVRKDLDPELKMKRDEAICKSFTSLVSYRYAENVLMYYPKAFEIDVRPIMHKALADGKRVAFPRCAPDGSPNMEFHFVNSDDDLEVGIFKIKAPKEGCEKFDKSVAKGPTVILVPALSFDKHGYRLGYGKGFYDRYIDKNRMTAVGIIYSDCIEDKLPKGRYDLSVHFMVTDKGVKIVD